MGFLAATHVIIAGKNFDPISDFVGIRTTSRGAQQDNSITMSLETPVIKYYALRMLKKKKI